MKSTFKILSKLALLAVVFGFFQPITCSMNGFELAKQLIRHETVKTTISAITLYVCFITVILSILFTLSLLLSRKKITTPSSNTTDWIFLTICIFCDIWNAWFLLSEYGKDFIEKGFYIISIGLGVSFIFLLINSSIHPKENES